MNYRPVLPDPHGLQMIDPFPALETNENARQLVGVFWRYDEGDVLPDGLRSRVAVHPLCARVPTRDYPLKGLQDDGVVGRLDDGRQAVARLLCQFALHDVADVALNNLTAVFFIDVADKLHFPGLSLFGLERQICIANIACLLQRSKRSLTRLLITEETDFPKLLTEKFGVRVAQQLHHKWIHVGDF